MAVWSLIKAYLTDPGAVPLGARPLVTVQRAQSSSISQQSSTVSDDNGINNNNNNNQQPSSPPLNPKPPKQQQQQQPQQQHQRAIRRCHKCHDNYKPNRAHHDSVTGRCIVKFDHFCPWVGNAVGALNHKFFVLFVSYTLMACCFCLILITMKTIHCGLPSPSTATATTAGGGGSSGSSSSSSSSSSSPLEEDCRRWDESYLGLVLLIVSTVFGIFTSCMLCEQIDAIKTNRSKIARMKMKVGNSGTELSRVTEEFNEMFGGTTSQVTWHWFLPLDVEFPRGMSKVVLGYEWDISFEQVPYQEPTTHNNNNNSIDSINNNSNSNNANANAAVRDLELGTMNINNNGSGTATNGPLGSPGGVPPSQTSSSFKKYPPSRTPSSSSSSTTKDKNSDHDIHNNNDGSGTRSSTTKDGLIRAAEDVITIPPASSPKIHPTTTTTTKSRSSYKVISRHNSRGKLT